MLQNIDTSDDESGHSLTKVLTQWEPLGLVLSATNRSSFNRVPDSRTSGGSGQARQWRVLHLLTAARAEHVADSAEHHQWGGHLHLPRHARQVPRGAAEDHVPH